MLPKELYNSSRPLIEASDPERGAILSWLRQAESAMRRFPAGEAMILLDPYDLLHRIATGHPAAQSLLTPILLKAFEAKMKGDSSIDPYLLHRAIARQLHEGNRALLGSPLRWVSKNLTRWYRELTLRRPPLLPPADLRQRAQILLNSDLRLLAGSAHPRVRAHLRSLLPT